MKVLSYNYIEPNSDGIVEALDRNGYTTEQYVKLFREYLDSVVLEGKVAVLYAGGVMTLASEARDMKHDKDYREKPLQTTITIKETAAYSMHKWIGWLKNNHLVEYASINGNTCASSMYALYEAQDLFEKGFDQVIIIAEERTTYNTIRIFDEHGIDIKLGEGAVVVQLGAGGSDIEDCQWHYEWNRNPFATTQSGYRKLDTKADYVNPHGTGTEVNELAEKVVTDGKKQLRYKESIGHTQGVSGLLEVCKVLDEDITGKVLCTSSGLGGFYGSCIVNK